MPQTILITGGTGLIGTHLTQVLLNKGYRVKHLSRNPKLTEKISAFNWDISKQEIDPKAFENVDAIIHLAGAGVANQRWSKERKKVILESRTKSHPTAKYLFI